MDLVAGLDVGTTSAKLVVLDSRGVVVARSQATYPTHSGPGGILEQDPRDWWRAASEVIANCGVAERIGALGLTGQMQNLILLRDGEPVRPAMLYSDSRAVAETEALHHELPDWEQRTGNQQDATNVPAKLRWLSAHESSFADGSIVLLGAPGYIGFRATAVAACDVTTASTTGLLDVTTGHWASDIAAAAGISSDALPRLCGTVAGDEVLGPLTADAAADLGLSPGIPVVHGRGDAGATTDGLVGSEPGDAYLYLGTSGWLAAVVGASDFVPSPIHSLVMPGWQTQLRIGAVLSAGAAADWSRQRFFPQHDFARVEELVAGQVTALASRPLCLPGLTGERTPVRDASQRLSLVGIQEATTTADLHLAVLTGVAMGLRHAADEMGLVQNRIALVGGGSASPAWRQILADVFGATIVTGTADEPAAHSAARSAAGVIGQSFPPLLASGRRVTETTPSAVHEAYQRNLPIHRSLYRALTPTFSDLAAARS